MNPITTLKEATDRTIQVIGEAQSFGWHSTQIFIPLRFADEVEKLLMQTPTLTYRRLKGNVFELEWTDDPATAASSTVAQPPPPEPWVSGFINMEMLMELYGQDQGDFFEFGPHGPF